MKESTRRIIAWIALASMALFVVTLIAWCFNRSLFHGAIGFAAIFTGGLGMSLFVVLHFTKPRGTAESEDTQPADVESDSNRETKTTADAPEMTRHDLADDLVEAPKASDAPGAVNAANGDE